MLGFQINRMSSTADRGACPYPGASSLNNLGLLLLYPSLPRLHLFLDLKGKWSKKIHNNSFLYDSIAHHLSVCLLPAQDQASWCGVHLCGLLRTLWLSRLSPTPSLLEYPWLMGFFSAVLGSYVFHPNSVLSVFFPPLVFL